MTLARDHDSHGVRGRVRPRRLTPARWSRLGSARPVPGGGSGASPASSAVRATGERWPRSVWRKLGGDRAPAATAPAGVGMTVAREHARARALCSRPSGSMSTSCVWWEWGGWEGSMSASARARPSWRQCVWWTLRWRGLPNSVYRTQGRPRWPHAWCVRWRRTTAGHLGAAGARGSGCPRALVPSVLGRNDSRAQAARR